MPTLPFSIAALCVAVNLSCIAMLLNTLPNWSKLPRPLRRYISIAFGFNIGMAIGNFGEWLGWFAWLQ